MRKKEGLIENYIDDECLILDTNTQKSHHLNGVATTVWRKLDDLDDIEKLVEYLVENFAVDREEVRKDVEQLLSNFMQAEILFAE
jgi:hypothetical protein